MAVAADACRYHPERVGIGICPSCEVVICEECATRVEGVLHCRECLARRAPAARSAGWRSRSALLPALALTPLAYLALTYGLYAFAAALALLRGMLLRAD